MLWRRSISSVVPQGYVPQAQMKVIAPLTDTERSEKCYCFRVNRTHKKLPKYPWLPGSEDKEICTPPTLLESKAHQIRTAYQRLTSYHPLPRLLPKRHIAAVQLKSAHRVRVTLIFRFLFTPCVCCMYTEVWACEPLLTRVEDRAEQQMFPTPLYLISLSLQQKLTTLARLPASAPPVLGLQAQAGKPSSLRVYVSFPLRSS